MSSGGGSLWPPNLSGPVLDEMVVEYPKEDKVWGWELTSL